MIYEDPTASDDPRAEQYVFGDFTLDLRQHSLSKAGVPVAIEPKVFDLLVLLVANAGALISRDRMIEEVWDGRIVSDAAISACVAAARRAVGDSGKAQTLIRTVARRGFTFDAPVDAMSARQAIPQGGLAPSIQFTKSLAGHSLAYAVSGSGPPILYSSFGATAIEATWPSPFFRPLFDAIGRQNTLVRFDEVGVGQSDRDTSFESIEARANDILRVADAAGCDRFGLFFQSGSSMPAIHLAAHYPDRVSAMVLNGGYAVGRDLRDGTTGTKEIFGMISEAWEKPESSFLLAYSLLYFPDGPLDLAKDVVEIMHSSCSAGVMLRSREVLNASSVVDLLPKVACPTLIVHARNDPIHPLSEARKMAAGIPNAELLILEAANHVPMPHSADWDGFLTTTLGFLNANLG